MPVPGSVSVTKLILDFWHRESHTWRQHVTYTRDMQRYLTLSSPGQRLYCYKIMLRSACLLIRTGHCARLALQCKAKRQHLFNLQVSRCCFLQVIRWCRLLLENYIISARLLRHKTKNWHKTNNWHVGNTKWPTYKEIIMLTCHRNINNNNKFSAG